MSRGPATGSTRFSDWLGGHARESEWRGRRSWADTSSDVHEADEAHGHFFSTLALISFAFSPAFALSSSAFSSVAAANFLAFPSALSSISLPFAFRSSNVMAYLRSTKDLGRRAAHRNGLKGPFAGV